MSKRDWPKSARLTESNENQEAPAENAGASSLEETLAEVVATTTLELRETSVVSRRGSVWDVVVISEGWSLNDRYYTREALAGSIPLWEGKDVCAYGWDPSNRGHVTASIEQAHPNGTFLNKVGFLKNVRGRIHEGRYELIADFICTNATLRQELVETLEHKGSLPGFSIHAEGEFITGIRDGRSGPIVTSITKTKELTLVSEPAAGGRGLRLVAGLTPNPKENEMKKLRKFLATALSAKQPKVLAEAMSATIDAMSDKDVLISVAESLKESGAKYMQKALDAINEGNTERAAMVLELAIEMSEGDEPKPDPEPPAEEPPVYAEQAPVTESKRIDETEQRLASIERRASLHECRSVLSAKLAEAQLPAAAHELLHAQFDGRVFKEADLDAAIQRTNKLLAINAGGDAQIVTESHNPRAQVLVESGETFGMAMNVLMGVDPEYIDGLTESQKNRYKALKKERFTKSIRRLYQEASGDIDLVHIGGRSLRESVNNTTFAKALGDSINLRLIQDFERQQQPEWEGWCEVRTDIDNLNPQKMVFLGGIGELPTVAEGATYVDLGEPMESDATYSLVKRGGYIPVTEEALINDRTGFIQSIPSKLRDAHMEAEEKLAYGLTAGVVAGVPNTTTSYTTAAHYSAGHFNYATDALSYDSFVAARTRLRNTRVPATKAVLDAAVASAVATSVTIQAENKAIRPGMYARIGTEYMLITGVSGVTLTVVRGQLGTSAASSHADKSVMWVTSGNLRLNERGDGPAFYVIVPTELEATILAILSSEKKPGGGNNDFNFLLPQYKAGKIVPVVVSSAYLGGSAKNWYLACPHSVASGIQIGYFNGQRAPQVINQTNEQVGQVFAADTMTFKVKGRVGGYKAFHEGSTGNIVP